jgi:tetratricopeptide (TPR) repeat protein
MDELLRLAGAAHAAGRLAEAEELVQRALSAEPGNVQANLLMGVLAGKTGRAELGLTHLNRVVTTNPDSFEALFWLSLLHRRQKNLAAATEFAERAVLVRSGDAHGHNNLGLCLLDQVRLEEAVAEFRLASSIRPDMPQILHNLGTALYLMGRDLEAAKAFDRALLLAPNSVQSFLNLGQVLLSQTNPGEAIKCAVRALQLEPNSAEAHLLMASALVEDSRTGEAEEHLKKAVELNPADAKAHGLLGQRFQSLGKFNEANKHLLKSIELEPRQGFAFFAYVHNNKVTEAERPFVQSMERLIDEGGLDPRQMMFLHYGLGRSYESLREYEKAMTQFDHANRVARKLKFGDEVFNREAYASSFDWLIRTFSKDFIETHRKYGHSSELPIVIVGMMRSGTTLAEQILSSHPQIGAAGEQRFWPLCRPQLFGDGGRAFSARKLPPLGARYVDALQKIAPDIGHVTDKMPANYEMLGAIHAALPNARIIHMRRNPVDTCISIYATPNRVPVDFAYDRDNIVFAYEQYLRLMAHWRVVLPADRFLEVNYEDVVADREKQAQRMLEHVGLEWDDALLHHETNERNVITPSLWQVRQPIYTSSVERWRRYEPWLGAFRRLLVENILR